jgi:hypothetical protein
VAKAVLRDWPREADRVARLGGSAWQVVAPGWRLRLTAAPTRLAGGAPAQVVLAEHEAAPLGSDWVYRTSLELFHDGGAAIALVPAAGATVLAADVDGRPVAPGVGRRPLPMARAAGANRVRVVWRGPPGCEPPRLEAGGVPLPQPPGLWALGVPAGMRGTAPGAELTPARAAAGRADGLAKLARLVAERGGAAPAPPGETEAGLYSDLFDAGTPLRWSAGGDGGAGPRLEAADAATVELAAGRTLVFLLALGGAALLNYTLGRPSRPEQWVALGCAGWLAFGPPGGLLFAALAAAGVVLRVVALARGLTRRGTARVAG